jgi:hypothetical protein
LRAVDNNLGERNSRCVLLELKIAADLPHTDTCAKVGITRPKGKHKCKNDFEKKIN